MLAGRDATRRQVGARSRRPGTGARQPGTAAQAQPVPHYRVSRLHVHNGRDGELLVDARNTARKRGRGRPATIISAASACCRAGLALRAASGSPTATAVQRGGLVRECVVGGVAARGGVTGSWGESPAESPDTQTQLHPSLRPAGPSETTLGFGRGAPFLVNAVVHPTPVPFRCRQLWVIPMMPMQTVPVRPARRPLRRAPQSIVILPRPLLSAGTPPVSDVLFYVHAEWGNRA